MKASSIDELLAARSPEVRELARDAGTRIMSVVPHATERIRAGWGLIGYNAPAYFAFVVPGEDSVRIGFEWGAELPDPSGLLEGKGKQVRYFTVRAAKDLDTRALADLLAAAAAMPPRPRRWG
jgi:hypothetical protein